MRPPIPDLCAFLLATCTIVSGAPAGAESLEDGSVEPWDVEVPRIRDPWEPMNRRVFAFNEFLDRWLLEPVAIAWDTVLPDGVQQSVENFGDNLDAPRRILNDVLQAKPAKAGNDLGRFLLNSTFGLAGFFDPATEVGLPQTDEDFGQTLGVWGVPPGPYLVLPLFGASSPRDAIGLAVDTMSAPEVYFLAYYVTYPSATASLVNSRSLVIEDVRAERASAFDFYAAVRNAHVSFRENQVRDRADQPEEEDDDFYYFDEEDDELYYFDEDE